MIRMNFPDTVTLYSVTEDGYGDKTLDSGTEVRAAFEQVISKGHSDFQDFIGSGSRLYLPPDVSEVTDVGYRLEGMIVKVNVLGGEDTQQFFRILTASPMRDTLRKNRVRHVECDLEKTTDFSDGAIS